MTAKVALLRSKSPAGVEPRLDKEARALAEAGYDVHVILWDRALQHPAEETRGGYRIHRVRLRAPEGRPGLLLQMPRWWLRAWQRLRELRPQAVQAVDLDSLLPALVARRAFGSRIVYDIFDFYGGMIALPLSPRLRQVLANVEQRAARHADLIILPDMARAGFFGDPRPRIIEVMNVPEDRPVTPKPQKLFTVFYGGQIARDRGLRELVPACEAVGARLVVAGHGPDEAALVPLIESSPAAIFLGNLPYDEVLTWTASCDVVAALYDPAIPNNRQASPNKVFEAMMLGKPLLTNEDIGLADLVRTEGIGLVARYGDSASVEKALEDLMLSPTRSAEMGTRARRLYEARYRWDAQRERLVGAYRELLGG
jgi:glycosyltransferase involved in cell wall biosynthesis